jgi:gas vesicle protein
MLPSVCSKFVEVGMSERNGGGFLWFLMGIGIGAVVGLLYAPQSGNETREILMAKAEEGRDFLRKRAEDAREQAETWAEKGREVYNSQREQVRSAVDAGRRAYREKVSAAKGDGENV